MTNKEAELLKKVTDCLYEYQVLLAIHGNRLSNAAPDINKKLDKVWNQANKLLVEYGEGK